jgi:hypothetical protein
VTKTPRLWEEAAQGKALLRRSNTVPLADPRSVAKGLAEGFREYVTTTTTFFNIKKITPTT